MIDQVHAHNHGRAASSPVLVGEERPYGLNSAARTAEECTRRKQRVTITLPVNLLERLRNAVYWTGHGTLARLITDALEDAVSQMEEANAGPFPERLAPLKRGRPRLQPIHLPQEPST